jgi:glycosyltransferase involved in cell wall biosynthesis
MIKHIINRLIKKKDEFPKPSLFEIGQSLGNIRNRSEILAICPDNTGPNWLGIKNATLSLFPDCTFIIPQYYSTQIYSDKELKQIADSISNLNFKLVVFSGFPTYFELLTKWIKGVKKVVVFHGALSELTTNRNQLDQIFEIAKKKDIQKIGFIKKGLKECFDSNQSLDCSHLILKTTLPNTQLLQRHKTMSIGIFGNSGFNKNLHNQVAAALLIENCNVNVLNDYKYAYLGKSERIINHEPLDKIAFLSLLGSMDINLHISFSESWGQIVTESLSLGVPCLTSNNNGIFDYDDFLAEKLIVNQYDNPVAITEKIKDVLANREEISERGIEYIQKLNKIADEKLKSFVE